MGHICQPLDKLADLDEQIVWYTDSCRVNPDVWQQRFGINRFCILIQEIYHLHILIQVWQFTVVIDCETI